MPTPTDFHTLGVPADAPQLITEGQLIKALGMTSYAGYKLRRLGVIEPVARTSRGLLYDYETLARMQEFRHDLPEGRGYLVIQGEVIF